MSQALPQRIKTYWVPRGDYSKKLKEIRSTFYTKNGNFSRGEK